MAKSDDPFRWFDSLPEVIRLVVMMYIKYPLSLRNVGDLLFERRAAAVKMRENVPLLGRLDSAADTHLLERRTDIRVI